MNGNGMKKIIRLIFFVRSLREEGRQVFVGGTKRKENKTYTVNRRRQQTATNESVAKAWEEE